MKKKKKKKKKEKEKTVIHSAAFANKVLNKKWLLVFKTLKLMNEYLKSDFDCLPRPPHNELVAVSDVGMTSSTSGGTTEKRRKRHAYLQANIDSTTEWKQPSLFGEVMFGFPPLILITFHSKVAPIISLSRNNVLTFEEIQCIW